MEIFGTDEREPVGIKQEVSGLTRDVVREFSGLSPDEHAEFQSKYSLSEGAIKYLTAADALARVLARWHHSPEILDPDGDISPASAGQFEASVLKILEPLEPDVFASVIMSMSMYAYKYISEKRG